MKTSTFLLLLLPVSVHATEFLPSVGDLQDPAKALSRSTMPVSLSGFLLEAGEDAAVQSFIAGLPEKYADLSNKLTSQVAFYQGNLPGAVQALENIGKQDVWVDAQKKYLQDLLALQLDFTESRSDHFVLRSSKRDAFLSQYALPALERAYEKAAGFYHVSLATPVAVEIYSDPAAFAKAAYVPEDSLERTGLLSAVKFRRIYLLSPRAVPAGYRWLDALAAGYQKLVLNKISGGLAPMWVKEGLARYGEAAWRHDDSYESAPADINRLAEAALVNPSTGALLIPFSRMDNGLRVLPNQDEVLLSQVEADDAVSGLVEDQGAEKLLALLSAFRTSSRDNAFSRVLGQSESEVEAAWVKSLEGRSWTLYKGALDRKVSLNAPDDVSWVGDEARIFLKAGDAFRDKRQWAGALVQYRKGLAVEPESGVLLLRAARASQALEDPKTAEQSLRRAVEKNPFYATPFVALGQLLYDDNRYDDAQRVLQEGLEIQPCHPRLHETLGFISLDVADVAAARRSFNLSLEFDPDNPNVRDTLRNMPK